MEMSDKQRRAAEAAHRLSDLLGHPRWLQSIGVGGTDEGEPTICVMLNGKPLLPAPVLEEDEWEGYPLDVRVVGPLWPLGKDPNEWRGY
jgi:hypothetical protein